MTEQEKWQKTLSLIPDGVQTLSKMPSKHIDGVYPKYIERGKGPYIYDSEGNEYTDYPLGLGAILLGHCIPEIINAVIRQAGIGNLFPLPSYLETDVAEKITNLVPCAEMVRFVKTGSEGTSAAVKICRAVTKREKIVCAGYHGWHDWYNSTTPKRNGCSKYVSCTQISHNNWQQILKNTDKDVGCIIIEPYILDELDPEYLQKVVDNAHDKGALVVFDETITFLRTPGGTASKYFNVRPDLSVFGKALANGYPIGCVCGKAEYIKVLEKDCFVSSTFGGELTSLAAANATLDFWKKNKVDEVVWERGIQLKTGFDYLIRKHQLQDTKIFGYPSRTSFKFPTELHKSLFWQECITRGIFLGSAQFVSYSHDARVIENTLVKMDEALYVVKENWQDPKSALRGKPAEETLRSAAIANAERNNQRELQESGAVAKPSNPIPANFLRSNTGNAR